MINDKKSIARNNATIIFISLFSASLLFFFLLLTVRGAPGTTEISNCSVLNITGETYLLIADINASINYCINISVNNITLDCQGHSITNTNCDVDQCNPLSCVNRQYAIFIHRESEENTNITIKNCVVNKYYDNAFSLINANSNTLDNITAKDSWYTGLYLSGSYNQVINSDIINAWESGGLTVRILGLNNTINNTNIIVTDNCNPAVSIEIDSNFTTISNSNISGSYGVMLYSSNNVIKNSMITNCDEAGIFLEVVESNLIYNNFFNNTNNFQIIQEKICSGTFTSCSDWWDICLYYEMPGEECCSFAGCGWSGTECSGTTEGNCADWGFEETECGILTECSYECSNCPINYWNTTLQEGIRIYSNGTQIGGNYWTNSSGTGYSDTCTDTNTDGFCDDAYTLATDNIDYLPYSDEYSADTCTYGGSGNWAVTCSDNCVWNTNQAIDGNISITGAGQLTLNANFSLTKDKYVIINRPGVCILAIGSGGGFR